MRHAFLSCIRRPYDFADEEHTANVLIKALNVMTGLYCLFTKRKIADCTTLLLFLNKQKRPFLIFRIFSKLYIIFLYNESTDIFLVLTPLLLLQFCAFYFFVKIRPTKCKKHSLEAELWPKLLSLENSF